MRRDKAGYEFRVLFHQLEPCASLTFHLWSRVQQKSPFVLLDIAWPERQASFHILSVFCNYIKVNGFLSTQIEFMNLRDIHFNISVFYV